MNVDFMVADELYKMGFTYRHYQEHIYVSMMFYTGDREYVICGNSTDPISEQDYSYFQNLSSLMKKDIGNLVEAFVQDDVYLRLYGIHGRKTYKGFKTENWYTVINGLGAGLLTSRAIKSAGKRFWPIASVAIVGFAHISPIWRSNKPSGPNVWMKRLGWIVSLRIFPIAVYNNKKFP